MQNLVLSSNLPYYHLPSMMVPKSIFASLILLAVLWLLLMREPSDSSPAYKLKVGPNRKLVQVLYGLKDEKTSSKARQQGSSSFRKVPSGPDPLHHNRGTPKSPGPRD